MLKRLLENVGRKRRGAAAAASGVLSPARLIRERRYEEAEALLYDMCRTHPADASAWHLLGVTRNLLRNYSAAVEALDTAVRLAPDNAEALYSFASAWRDTGNHERARSIFHRVCALRPDWFAGYVGLAELHTREGRVDDAEDMYGRAIELAPQIAQLRFEYARALMFTGRVDEAIEQYRAGLEIDPSRPRVYSSMLSAMQYSVSYTPEQVRDAHYEYDRRYAKPLAPKELAFGARPGNRSLRVGYVSPDFRHHAVGSLMEPALKHHDRSRFTLYCYSDVLAPDERTQRFRSYAHLWRDVSSSSDEEVAQTIRSDEIDILIDLAGHTDNNRLPVFARKPAPIQITWIGHPNTTGMAAMDYRISDAYADPPGTTEHLHSEKLLRLPEIYLPFAKPDEDVDAGPLPCIANGHVTFGSFNSFLKVNADVVDLWARILAALPGSRMLIVTVPEGRARARILECFAARGIGADRIDFEGRLSPRAFLEAYARVDIALDTYPYHGTTTTAYTLWMSVPVITLAGGTHLSRVGVSMLTNVGLPQLVASDEDDYVARAVALANDRAQLTALRETLRSRMEAAPNMSGERFARALETKLLEVWESAGGSPR